MTAVPDLRATFAKAYPEGSIGPGSGQFRGQCAVYAETVIKLQTPGGIIGLDLQAKKQMIALHGIPADKLNGKFQIGDVVIQDYGVIVGGVNYGHVSVVDYFPNGLLQYSECNFYENLRVTHGRTMSPNDEHIVGVLRGTLNVPFVNPPASPENP